MWLHFYILKYKSSVHLVIRLFWLLSYNSVVILIWSWEKVSIVYLLCHLEQKLQFYNLLILALLICVLYIIMVLIFIP